MEKIYNWFLNKILKKKLFFTVDIAEEGQDYSCFCLYEIDKDGVIKIKKIEHTSN